MQDRYGLCLMMVEVGKMKLVVTTPGGGGANNEQDERTKRCGVTEI